MDPTKPDAESQPDIGNQAIETEPMLHCPTCGTLLTGHKCKLVCRQCGYYMSCADFY